MTAPLLASPRRAPARRTRRSGLVVLGDSVSSGDGVGLVTPLEQTWGALLTRALGERFTSVAACGATTAQVRAHQLAPALAARPRVAAVLTGLNDVVKTPCEPGALRADLTAIVAPLHAGGTTVLLVRLHDPSGVFTMPGVVARGVRARITSVNAVVDAVAAEHPGTLVLDLGALPGLRDRAAWCVDRVHPSAWGQAVIAAGAAAALGCPGLVDPGPAPAAPSTLAHAGWLVRSGSPWLARRFGEVGPAVGGMALRSALGRPGGRPA